MIMKVNYVMFILPQLSFLKMKIHLSPKPHIIWTVGQTNKNT